jgi:hypothetical protein
MVAIVKMEVKMRKLFKCFMSGVVFLLGIVTAGFMAAQIQAASLSYLTGPQPTADMVAVINSLIANINANLAPAGTAAMSAFFNLGTNLQIVNTASWTAATTSCALSNTKTCLVVVDSSGTTHYIPAY